MNISDTLLNSSTSQKNYDETTRLFMLSFISIRLNAVRIYFNKYRLILLYKNDYYTVL